MGHIRQRHAGSACARQTSASTGPVAASPAGCSPPAVRRPLPTRQPTIGRRGDRDSRLNAPPRYAAAVRGAVYFVNLSSNLALNAVREAPRAPTSTESRPVYLYLDKTRYELSNGVEKNYLCWPPLREPEDQEALAGPLRWMLFKRTPLDQPGQVVWPCGRRRKHSHQVPTPIFVLIDPERCRHSRESTSESRSDFEPYDGYEITGWALTVIDRGDVIIGGGHTLSKPGRGQFLRRSRPQPPDPPAN